MPKKALITGVTGQDGAYMSQLLLEKGYEVYGTFRRLSTPNFWRIQSLGTFGKINLIPFDLSDMSSIIEAIKISEPDEIYNFAAQSFVGASFEQPLVTGDVTGIGVTKFLEGIRHLKSGCKFYQASTSEMFGFSGNNGCVLTENDSFRPLSPYAAAKLYAYWIARIYREAYHFFACNGILFNHESPIRGMEFVTRKISNTVAKIALGLEKNLELGSMSAKRDWGYAPEYVEAAWRIMQQDEPDDFIVATGVSHSVEEFVQIAFDTVGLDWQEYVKVEKRFLRPLDVQCLTGDCSKTKSKLGWSHKTEFEDLVKMMVKEDLDKWQRWLKGERFPWDAPNYPNENGILTRALRM
jgi:GDPmannose 4,6-dehydratase